MSAPLNKYTFKGIQVCDWGDGKFSVEKRYKPKDSDVWKPSTRYFRNELIELEKLIHEALSQPIQEASTQGKSLIDSLPAKDPVPFDDQEDLPF